MGFLKSLLLFSLTLLLGLPAWAKLRLYEWTPGTTLAPLVLPVREHESPEQAAQRYLRQLNSNPDLMELFAGQSPYLPEPKFQEITESHRHNQALLIANAPKDYTLNSERVKNFTSLLAKQGQRATILPLSANLGLSLSETRELYQQINEKFPMMVAMGGDDVDPAQYKKQNFHAHNIIPTRDQFEVQLIRSYVSAAKGFLLGVCRGAQISAVAMGYRLIQDLPFHIGEKVSHANDWHTINIHLTKHKLLADLAPHGKLQVNSLHHQSIIYKDGGPLELAARSQDGVTEALEFRNGKGLLLQFHPELMGNALGEQIIAQAVRQKQKVTIRSCRNIFL